MHCETETETGGMEANSDPQYKNFQQQEIIKPRSYKSFCNFLKVQTSET